MASADTWWARFGPLLADRAPKRGGRRRDHREAVDALAYRFRTGAQWVRLPETYGGRRGVRGRLRMWAVDGSHLIHHLMIFEDGFQSPGASSCSGRIGPALVAATTGGPWLWRARRGRPR
ncbi:transposase [Streptomyces sp. WP-1]|uniref:transposase n=1 Tax=Streptomyces sp. WP-1 TaxID=3041497 RepID=UPI00351B2C02